ncbi:MAG: lytic transglycosylase domain-containing protein [Desulfosporosinus sp.]|nr:lytic transglycosylase domain-containing protein [Desulfosporosinus sp.]
MVNPQSNGAKLAQYAGRFIKKMAKKKLKTVILHILKVTAPMWGPVVLVLFLAYTAYMILFSIPQQAMQGVTSTVTQVEAFLGITESSNGVPAADAHLLDDYKTIANTWDAGLTKEQQSQVMVYKFPWSALAAVDRVVNDDAVWDGKQNVVPHPQEVFDALRPKFAWKDSTVTTVTVAVLSDSKGNKTTSTSTDVRHVSLVTAANTFEGHFGYTYKWQTNTSPGTNGSSVTVTREVVQQVTPPTNYYAPLKQYLIDKRGITDEATFEVVEQIAMIYDTEYQFNVGLQGGQNFATYPAYALAYADAVQQVLTQHVTIPQPLFLALIAHESGGNWQAVNNQNTNGTTDAGLCQINSVNWAKYGLTNNPFNVPLNIQAGATILGQALGQYNDFSQALYAYNGGTASNGRTYNPSYAPAVMNIFTQLQSTQAYAALVPATTGQPRTILAAEQDGTTWQAYGQSGEDFANPQEITVVDERTGETQKIDRTSGDGTMWAQEAWVYHPEFKDLQKGDTLNVQFDDGKSTEIKVAN